MTLIINAKSGLKLNKNVKKKCVVYNNCGKTPVRLRPGRLQTRDMLLSLCCLDSSHSPLFLPAVCLTSHSFLPSVIVTADAFFGLAFLFSLNALIRREVGVFFPLPQQQSRKSFIVIYLCLFTYASIFSPLIPVFSCLCAKPKIPVAKLGEI